MKRITTRILKVFVLEGLKVKLQPSFNQLEEFKKDEKGLLESNQKKKEN